MLADLLAVKEYLRIMSNAIKGEKHSTPFPQRLCIDHSAVARDGLILLLGKVIEGQLPCCVRDSYGRKTCAIKISVKELFIKIIGKLPIIVYINPAHSLILQIKCFWSVLKISESG